MNALHGHGSLFDRLVAGAPARHRLSRLEQAGLEFEAIKRHLEYLLNTRQGCSQSSPRLGLRDFNGHGLNSADLLRQVTADIRHTLHRYEPRLKVRSLHCVPDVNTPLELHFRLDGLVRVHDREEQLQIELLVNGHNRYTRVR